MGRALALAAALGAAGAAQAGSLRFCGGGTEPTAREHDRLLRLAALVRDALAGAAAQHGAQVALVARSGLSLDWLGQRYSHAGLALRDSPEAPWAVRQLYYDCDQGRPRLFDQGLPGFVLGMDSPSLAHVSVLLLPAGAGADLARAALDRPRALGLIGARYSANAHAFSTRYQNCNQWVAELMASAWGALPLPAAAAETPDAAEAADTAGRSADQRAGAARPAAQAWLRAHGYEPTTVTVGWRPLSWLLGLAVPWVHEDDHPPEDLDAARFRVSLPPALELLAQRLHPGTTRLEFCLTERHIVQRRGGPPLAEGCVPEAGDAVLALD